MLDIGGFQLRQRDYLLRINQAISAQLDLPTVLGLVVEYAVEIVAGNYGFIALYEGTDADLRIAVAHNIDADSFAAFAPLLRVLADHTSLREAKGLALSEVADQLGLPLRQMVALPLLVRGISL